MAGSRCARLWTVQRVSCASSRTLLGPFRKEEKRPCVPTVVLFTLSIGYVLGLGREKRTYGRAIEIS